MFSWVSAACAYPTSRRRAPGCRRWARFDALADALQDDSIVCLIWDGRPSTASRMERFNTSTRAFRSSHETYEQPRQQVVDIVSSSRIHIVRRRDGADVDGVEQANTS